MAARHSSIWAASQSALVPSVVQSVLADLADAAQVVATLSRLGADQEVVTEQQSVKPKLDTDSQSSAHISAIHNNNNARCVCG